MADPRRSLKRSYWGEITNDVPRGTSHWVLATKALKIGSAPTAGVAVRFISPGLYVFKIVLFILRMGPFY